LIIKSTFPVDRLTSIKQHGLAKSVLIIESVQELIAFYKTNQPYTLIGKGSNSIIHPDCFLSPILQLSQTLTPVSYKQSTLTVPAGLPTHHLMGFLQKYECSSLEFSAGVPASVGGMVTMNFGCWGHSISTFLIRARFIDSSGNDMWLTNEEIEFGYRTSIIQKNNLTLIEAEFLCTPSTKEKIKARIDTSLKKRLAHQPLRHNTFGSIFKNPIGDFAGRLIEESGLKGHSIGNLHLSNQHANFMVNTGHSTYKDIVEFLQTIQDIVLSKTGIHLEKEVKSLTPYSCSKLGSPNLT
jgi:UDP-N-acetylmuramate dehydrogenase